MILAAAQFRKNVKAWCCFRGLAWLGIGNFLSSLQGRGTHILWLCFFAIYETQNTHTTRDRDRGADMFTCSQVLRPHGRERIGEDYDV